MGEPSETQDPNSQSESKHFHFKSFKEKIIKNKNQNTLNFNNLNILVEGTHAAYEPIVTSFKNFSHSANVQKKSTRRLPEQAPGVDLNQFKSPDKKDTTGIRRVSESMTDLTFKKKYLRSRGGGRNMRPNSSVVLDRQRNDSPVLFYKSENNPDLPIFKSDSFKRKKPPEAGQMETIQNLKYQITGLTCRTNSSREGLHERDDPPQHARN